MSLRERKKEEQKKKIIECSIELFKENGFDYTSIEEILEKANISRGTLYNYFPEKAAILSEYIHDLFIDYKYNKNETTDKKIKMLVEYTSLVFGENLELTKVYFAYRKSEKFVNPLEDKNTSGIKDIVKKIILDGQLNGEIRNDLDQIFLITTLRACILSGIMSFIYSEKKIDLDKMTSQISEMFLRGAMNESINGL